MKRYTVTKTCKADGVKFSAGSEVDADEVAANVDSMLRLGQLVESSSPAAKLVTASEVEKRDAEIERLREKLEEYDQEAADLTNDDQALSSRQAAKAEIEKLRGQLAALTAIKPPEPVKPAEPATDKPEVPEAPEIKPGEAITVPSGASLVGPPGEVAEPKPGAPKAADPKHKKR